MNETPPLIDRLYRHYGGGLYRVLCLARCERFGVAMVVYRSQDDGAVWVRSVAEWNTPVNGPGGQVERYTLQPETP